MVKHIDARSLTIKEYNEVPPSENSLISLTTLHLHGGEVDLDDIPDQLLQEIKIFVENGSPSILGYDIFDTRKIQSIGASAFIQDIFLEIITTSTSEVTKLLLEKLQSLGLTKEGNVKEKKPIPLEIDSIKRQITLDFCPQGRLEVLEKSNSRILLRDRGGNRYEVDSNSEGQTIRKIAN